MMGRRGVRSGQLLVGRAVWRAAVRWRAAVTRELSQLGLSFSEWLVLDATWQLMLELDDAVNQAMVVVRSGLDKMTVSRAMRALEASGSVTRGPDLSGPAYRIFVTKRGEHLARHAEQCVNRLSAQGVSLA